jgi:hypothetical protein
MSKKLELNRETLRDLSDATLHEVTGGNGVPTDICGGDTQTFVCPSGATWFTDCESTWIKCT